MGDAPQPILRKVLRRMAINAIIVLGLYLVVGRLVVRQRDTEREQQLNRYVDHAVAGAQDRAAAKGPPGCRAVLQPSGHTILDLAEVLAHREMLGLTDDQASRLQRARVACEEACSRARADNTAEGESRRVHEHARRVLDALSCLSARQRGLVDEWLGGELLRQAAGNVETTAPTTHGNAR